MLQNSHIRSTCFLKKVYDYFSSQRFWYANPSKWHVALNKHWYPAELKDGSTHSWVKMQFQGPSSKCGRAHVVKWWAFFNVAELKLSNVQLLCLFCIEAQNSPQILHLLGLPLKLLPLWLLGKNTLKYIVTLSLNIFSPIQGTPKLMLKSWYVKFPESSYESTQRRTTLCFFPSKS